MLDRSSSNARAVAACAIALGVSFGPGAAAAPSAGVPDVAMLLARYQRAVADAGVAPIAHMATKGTIAGAGLTGEFRSWVASDRERTEQNLGPRSESTLRVGERIWYADADGDVREFTGVLARRERTQHFIDSGAFASAPERCVSRGLALVHGVATYALDVTAPQGETETLYLDAASGLPDRVAFDDDDGRTTIDMNDYRTVAGRRFPFHLLTSNGDHAFDLVQTTQSIDVVTQVSGDTFAPLVPRRIAMTSPQTISIDVREGHAYAPVTIGDRTFTFLLDTGAQNVLIDKHVAADLGLAATGALEASGASRTGGLQLARVRELAIGTGTLRDLVATTIDLGASTVGAFRIDGILGYPFFASATVRIDLARKLMTFGPPGSFVPGGDRIALELDRAFPEARLHLNASTEAPFIVDTGNAAELLLYKPFVDRHPGIVPFSRETRHSFGIGGATVSYRTALERLDVGSTAIYHVETDVMQATRGAFADRFDAGNLGLGVLKNFIVTFDLANGAMYLEPGAAFDDGRTRK